MDASNEFRFVVPSEGLHKKSRQLLNSETADSSSSDRTVPVCVYNTNKNLKLRFLWDRAFKLLHSNRTIYRAVSGINYQDYGGGGTTSRSECIRSSGISLRAKSLSHSHLSGLGDIMESPGRSRDNRFLSQGRSSSPGRNHLPSVALGAVVRNDRAVEETDSTSVVPVAMPRKKHGNRNNAAAAVATTSKSGVVAGGTSCTNTRNPTASSTPGASSSSSIATPSSTNANIANTTSTTRASKKNHERPVSISGGEKPKGDEGRRMNDNCKNTTTGNSNRLMTSTVPVHLRRSHSTRSRTFSPDSLSTNCSNSSNNNNAAAYNNSNNSPVTPRNQLHSQSSFRRTGASSPFLSGGSLSCYHSDKDGNLSDCSSSEVVSLGYNNNAADSGLDTWTKKSPPTSSSNNNSYNDCSGMKSRDSVGIVCTISQRIPSNSGSGLGSRTAETRQDHNQLHLSKSSPLDEKTSRKSACDSCDDGCQKMSRNNSPPACGNTTVVLINGCFEAESSAGGISQNSSSAQYDSLNLSDYDFECMSEIDLNSESGGSGGGSTGISGRDELNEDKAKYSSECHHSSDNELDSLDLTLFEGARRNNDTSAAVTCKKNSCKSNKSSVGGSCASTQRSSAHIIMGVKCEGENEPWYDTVSTDDTRFPEGTYGSLPNREDNNASAWSDAGSEFEFMTPSTPLSNHHKFILSD